MPSFSPNGDWFRVLGPVEARIFRQGLQKVIGAVVIPKVRRPFRQRQLIIDMSEFHTSTIMPSSVVICLPVSTSQLMCGRLMDYFGRLKCDRCRSAELECPLCTSFLAISRHTLSPAETLRFTPF